MRREYHPPRTPVLELYVQCWVEPNNGNLILEIGRTLGLYDSVIEYRDFCTTPVDQRILNELEQAFEGIFEFQIRDRWGIQENLLLGNME